MHGNASEAEVQADVRRNSDDLHSLNSGFGSDLQRVSEFMQRSLGATKPPSPTCVSAVLEAGGGASVPEIFSYIEQRFAAGYRPGTKDGPRSYQWFVRVIANKFGGLPDTEVDEVRTRVRALALMKKMR